MFLRAWLGTGMKPRHVASEQHTVHLGDHGGCLCESPGDLDAHAEARPVVELHHVVEPTALSAAVRRARSRLDPSLP
jgi:hypothetical protein